MREQLKRVDLTLKNKAYFHFALAQGYEVVGEYDEAFFHLDCGNKIKNKNVYFCEKNLTYPLLLLIFLPKIHMFHTQKIQMSIFIYIHT